METLIVSLDIVLVAVALWSILVARGIGGIMGGAFTWIVAGVVLLGIAHLVETITFEIMHWSTDAVELVHRLIVMLGFVFLTVGFLRIQSLK